MKQKGFETAFFVGQPLRVLLVEDAEAEAELTVNALKKHGYRPQVDLVASPQEFTDHLSKAAYDVVLSDFNLPGWTGLEVLGLLASLQQDTPFILVTGALSDMLAAEFIDKGADDYVLKDQLERLPLAVRRVLRERRLLTERQRAADERERLITKLQDALSEVKRLTGLLPLCVTCKRVLSTKGYWSRIELFIENNSEARISPSLCPDCADRFTPEHHN